MVQVICTEDDGSGAPVFPRDLFLITEADPQPALVIVDAWLDTVPPGISVRDPQQARQALHPWKEAAVKTDAAVLLLCHTNRVATPNARDRYGATGELRKKARMTLFAQTDDDGRLIVGPEKMNSAAPVPASTFTITAVPHFPPTADDDGTVPLLAYVGESTQTAREHITDNYAAEHGATNKDVDDTVGWLAVFLAGGPRWATDVQHDANVLGITEKKLRRAKQRLHVESERETGKGPWYWQLPQHRGHTPASQAPSDAPVPDMWASGASEKSHQPSHALSTSQDSLMTNGEIQRASETPGDAAVSHNNAPNHSRFTPDPPCFHCDKPVVSKYQDEHGRYAHITCQRQAEEVKP
jgi:hypothetical protein